MTDDFLDTSDIERERQHALAVDYARLYTSAFVDNPAGATLLADWTERLLNKRIPINAPHTEYAAVEAVRAFVHDIHQQIEMARRGS